MSARDDGHRATGSRPPRPGRRAAIVRLAVFGAVLGPALGIALGPRLARERLPLFEAHAPWLGPAPAPAEWPRPPGAGESAETRTIAARTTLVVRAPTAAGAQALALDLALPRLDRARDEARAARREEWCGALLQGPVAMLSRFGDCAALLSGWAEAWRVAAVPAKSAGKPGRAEPEWERGSALPIEHEVARRALAGDAPGLADALGREARMARAQLLARLSSLPADRRDAAAQAWRRGWGRRAAELEAHAAALEERMPEIERGLVERVAPARALDAEPEVADPEVVLQLAAGGPEGADVRPVAWTWVLFAALGSALGILLALPLSRGADRERRARDDELARRFQGLKADLRAAALPVQATNVEARLQVVSGSHPRRVARAVRELAARFVAGGERVLVMDGGRHLRLHDFFGAQPHLGFQECMRERLPLLGVVQSGGLPGLYVLAHGAPSRLRSWLPLRRLLDDARPHFSRVVLALDPNIARQAGEALAGRLVDGWWTGTDAHRARDARRFSARLGIPLENVEPVVPEHATVAALVTELAREREMATVPAAAPAIAEPVATPASVPAAAAPAPEPATDLSPLEMLVEELMRDAARTPEPELASLDTMVEELAGDGAGAPAGTEALEPGAIVAARAPEPAPWEAAAMEAPAAEHPRPLEVQPSGRAPGLDDAPGLAPAPAREGALQPSALMPPPDAPALANAAQDPAQEPVVLEVDPEVRERLRFLVWMRKLRDKTRREVAHVR